MEVVEGFRFLREIDERNARDREIAYGMINHLIDSRKYFKDNQIAFLALQGSQNYNLDTASSDIDTKLILLPSLNDLIFNRKAISTTHVRDNNEHTDWKDLRLMFQTFRKQNLNFVEVLYSPWVIINETYEKELMPLFEQRDLVGHYSPYMAVKTMKGIALNKYDAMEKDTPAHAIEMEKFGYSPKELHHLIRITTFMEDFLNGYEYSVCLTPDNATWLKGVKLGGYPLEEARKIADECKETITNLSDTYMATHECSMLAECDTMLNKVQSDVMSKCIRLEIEDE